MHTFDFDRNYISNSKSDVGDGIVRSTTLSETMHTLDFNRNYMSNSKSDVGEADSATRSDGVVRPTSSKGSRNNEAYVRFRIGTSIMIFIIRCYKKFISPMLGNNCRFIPSCSEYAMEAYSEYGFIKGSYLTIFRLLRCAPWRQGGYDPVPKKKKEE